MWYLYILWKIGKCYEIIYHSKIEGDDNNIHVLPDRGTALAQSLNVSTFLTRLRAFSPVTFICGAMLE